MRIAFDVKGTLEGPKGSECVRLYRHLQSLGHDMFIWSNSLSYAIEAKKKFNLDGDAIDKFSRSEASEWQTELMDLAVEDDRNQTWLAARAIVFVDELVDDRRANMILLTKTLTLEKSST